MSEVFVKIQGELKCRGCSAILKYEPGTVALKCEFCGETTEILHEKSEQKEINYRSFIQTKALTQDKTELSTVKCDGCNAEITLRPSLTSDLCPFCGTPLIIKSATVSTVMKPSALLPFSIKHQEAKANFKNWIKGLWLAPNDIKDLARGDKEFHGMYIPYWTYDSATDSRYFGERGINRTETYTSNGKTQTRIVTDWYPVSGHVSRAFDDVLVVASASLPESYAHELEPWDLKELVKFEEKFLSGFQTECYQIDVPNGWEKAKGLMDTQIRRDVCRHIGGDRQRIITLDTTFDRITFKHVLLPIWISSYRYRGKPFRFLVNGRTGEVQGERPWSWVKIFFLVLVGIAIFIAVGETIGWENTLHLTISVLENLENN